jgi:adenylosuccinate lyase
MVSIHERDQISGAGELKEICLNTEKLLKTAGRLFEQLVVRSDVMLRNLYKTKGLILAEEVMFCLGKKIGKHTAHELVRQAARNAVNKNMSLKEALLTHADIADHLTMDEIDLILEPKNYVGLSCKVVDRLIDATHVFRETDPI